MKLRDKIITVVLWIVAIVVSFGGVIMIGEKDKADAAKQQKALESSYANYGIGTEQKLRIGTETHTATTFTNEVTVYRRGMFGSTMTDTFTAKSDECLSVEIISIRDNTSYIVSVPIDKFDFVKDPKYKNNNKALINCNGWDDEMMRPQENFDIFLVNIVLMTTEDEFNQYFK